MNPALRKYLEEALGLGIFMFSAAFFDALINFPGLPIRDLIGSDLLRRFFVGLSMGATALYIFTSGFGKQSGAYINPAITVIMYIRHDINLRDGFFYILFQTVGGIIGIGIVVLLLPGWMADPAVNYIVTVPGPAGVLVAFMMEMLISFILIVVVLKLNGTEALKKYSSLSVAVLITLYITFESPFSGMSMNPARSFASAMVSNQWTAFWLYCIAPLSGMYLGSRIIPIKRKSGD